MKVKLAYDVSLQGPEESFEDREALRQSVEELLKTKFTVTDVEYLEEIESEYEKGDPSFEEDEDDDDSSEE